MMMMMCYELLLLLLSWFYKFLLMYVCVLDLYVHNQMFVVVILNEKGKVMNGKISLLDPALQLSWPMKPGKMSTSFVHSHLGAFEFVQFLPDGSLVLGGEPRPRFVRPPVVVVRLRHLDVIDRKSVV